MTDPHPCAGPGCTVMLEGRGSTCSRRCQQAARRAVEDLMPLEDLGAPAAVVERFMAAELPRRGHKPERRFVAGVPRPKAPPAPKGVRAQGVSWGERGDVLGDLKAWPYRGIVNKSGLPFSGAPRPPARRSTP